MRAARLAACDRARFDRRRAALRACRERAVRDAARCGSRFRARVAARARRGDGFRRLAAARVSLAAWRRVRSLVLPLRGAGSLTPARRALDRPIAIACFVDRAPCFPCRTCSISSRTNSPACVDGAFPLRRSFRARAIVRLSGIVSSRDVGGAQAAWPRLRTSRIFFIALASICRTRSRDSESRRPISPSVSSRSRPSP